jgi:hypothetical protein
MKLKDEQLNLTYEIKPGNILTTETDMYVFTEENTWLNVFKGIKLTEYPKEFELYTDYTLTKKLKPIASETQTVSILALDPKWKYLAVDADGEAWLYQEQPIVRIEPDGTYYDRVDNKQHVAFLGLKDLFTNLELGVCYEIKPSNSNM